MKKLSIPSLSLIAIHSVYEELYLRHRRKSAHIICTFFTFTTHMHINLQIQSSRTHLPVRAAPNISLPTKACGIHAFCISVIVQNCFLIDRLFDFFLLLFLPFCEF